MEATKRPLVVRGQNSGLYQMHNRQYYGIFRVERASRPNAMDDSILVQIAENCSQEDAIELATAVNLYDEIVEALQKSHMLQSNHGSESGKQDICYICALLKRAKEE